MKPARGFPIGNHWTLFAQRTPPAAFGKVVLNECRLAWRLPVGLVLGMGLPLLLLVIFGSIPSLHKPVASLAGLTYFDVSFPVLVSLVIAILGIVDIPSPLATYREQGILRRLSTTPAPPAWLLAAQLVINFAMAIAGLAILTVVGIAAFGLDAPKSILGFVVATILSIAAVFAIGLWIAAVARTSVAAKAISLAVLFPLLFFGGLWLPRELMPPFLLGISNLTPLGASVQAIQTSMQGTFPPLSSLLVLAVYAVVFAFLGVRFFKWE
ncbi:MAG: ABC transporter permease [Candidatus Binataceae bacterium]